MRTILIDCPRCNGEGSRRDERCDICHGEGSIEEELLPIEQEDLDERDGGPSTPEGECLPRRRPGLNDGELGG